MRKLARKPFMQNGGAYVLGGLYMVALVLAPLLLIGADLTLGPQFMTAYVEQTGLYNGPLAIVIPWALSICTTGFQYLLIRGVREHGFWKGDLEVKVGILIGLVVLVFDTASDVAGVTSWWKGPAIGMQVIPPEGERDMAWIILASITIIVCALNEFMLDPALKWITNEQIPSTDLPNRRAVERLARLISKLYEYFKFLAQTFAIGAIAVLDICLIVYFFVTTFEAERGSFGQGAAIVAVAIGALVLSLRIVFYLFWRTKYRAKTARRAAAKQTKAVAPTPEPGSKKKKKPKDSATMGEQLSTVLMLIISFCGIGLSIGGFTMLMYGPGSGIFPVDPSLAWKIVAVVIGALCGFYLPFAEMGYGKKKGDVSGGLPGGGLPGGGMPGGMPSGMPSGLPSPMVPPGGGSPGGSLFGGAK